jgi:pimeloyl-ACP methyl ester carboxylesterase
MPLTRRALIAGASLMAAAHAEPARPSSKDVGSFAVEESGDAAETLVLIPGLACGAWAFEEITRRLSPRFAIHALTLPGFDGRPPIGAPIIERVAADVAAYVAERRLRRPILIGHSLGAFVALKAGLLRSSALGGIVAIDGFPVFAPLAQATPEERVAEARRRAEPFLAAADDPARFRSVLNAFLAARMRDPERAARFAERAARSDPRATAAYVVEMLSADLRPELSRLEAPLLALAATDSYLAGRSEQEIADFYTGLHAGAPKATVLLVRDSRHFAAVDQPDVVGAAIEAFAAGLRHVRA